ncbi:MAG: DUF6788 family protein [Terriglobia bacterium]
MPNTLSNLESQRATLLAQFPQLGDLRPGSIVTIHRRCGKPNCHCAQANDPGHGPDIRLTYKVRGKTKTEALAGSAAVRKAEREIAEFRKFQRLTEACVGVNQQICQQRPVEEEEEPQTDQEKKRSTRSTRKSRAK